MTSPEIFADRLINLRESSSISQQELADYLGITRQSLSLYEKAARTINIDLLVKIANYFKVSSDYLLGLSEVQSTNDSIKTTCEVTGLSELAVRNLIKCKESGFDEFTIGTASQIVSNELFFDLSEELWLLGCMEFQKTYLKVITPFLNKLINNKSISVEKREESIIAISHYFNLSSDSIYADRIFKKKHPKEAENLGAPENYSISDFPRLSIIRFEESADAIEYKAIKLYQKIVADYLINLKKDFMSEAIETNQSIAKFCSEDGTNKDLYDCFLSELKEAINNAEDREKKE